MSTSPARIEVSGIEVEVVRKDIKNLHLAVYPPAGRVRVAVPEEVGPDAVRLAVVSRLGWIREQQNRLKGQVRQSRRDLVNGESHYVWGRRYRLTVVENGRRPAVRVRSGGRLELQVPSGSSRSDREAVLARWYRRELKAAVPPLVDKWVARLHVDAPAWGIKKMKTRWGSCSQEAGRIWLNLELAKKRPECLDYVVLHEVIHLLERNHTDRFKDLLEQAMPQWRTYREELNRAPLAHEDWTY
jgi:predicted metal-dependent hydrolase